MGKSAFGPSIKAGGPNYVAQLMDFTENAEPEGVDLSDDTLRALAKRVPTDELEGALRSYTKQAQEEFACEHDHQRLLGQDNLRRYRSIRQLCICLHADDTQFEIAARIGAAHAVGCDVSITGPGVEAWSDFATVVPKLDATKFNRLRYATPERVPETICRAANEACIYVADARVLSEGRLELLWYVEEQSLSNDYHRYGNLGPRFKEKRRGPSNSG